MGLRSWLPWVPAVVSFGGFLLLRYFGHDPFPGRVGTVTAVLGAVAFPLIVWWLARDWRPPALIVPGLTLTLVPYSAYRHWLGSGMTAVLLGEAIMLITQILFLIGAVWALVKAHRRGAWR